MLSYLPTNVLDNALVGDGKTNFTQIHTYIKIKNCTQLRLIYLLNGANLVKFYIIIAPHKMVKSKKQTKFGAIIVRKMVQYYTIIAPHNNGKKEKIDPIWCNNCLRNVAILVQYYTIIAPQSKWCNLKMQWCNE